MISIKVKGDYIDGKFRRPRGAERRVVSSDPGDAGWRIGAFPLYPQHVERAAQAARRSFAAWRRVPLERRADFLRKFAAEVFNRRRELARLVAAETGKPLWEAEQEVNDVKAQVETEIREGIRAVSPFKVGEVRFGVKGLTRYRPLGPVLVLGAAISPVHLPCGHILPALLSGCPVVFKPSKLVPACGQLLAELFDAVELPPGVFNLVQGDAESGLQLALHQDLAGVFFTGCLAAGRRILETTASQPHKLVSLQMGGVNLAVVCEDADLERAWCECLQGSFLTTGQQYTSTSIIAVHKKVLERFVEAFVELAGRIRVGYAFDKGGFMGPLLSAAAQERFLDSQQRLASLSGRALRRAEALKTGRPGHYVGPAVWLLEEPASPDVVRPEGINFGPDVVLLPFGSDKEGLELARLNSRPLAAAVFTGDEERFRRWATEIPYGLCNHNLATTDLSLRLPLNAAGQCGNHRPGGVFSQRNFCEPVATLQATGPYRSDRLPPGLPRPEPGRDEDA